MKIGGHTTESIYRRYAIVAQRDIADVLRKVAAFQKSVDRAATEGQMRDSRVPSWVPSPPQVVEGVVAWDGVELANSGNQHRIGLLNREPGDSGDESLATSLVNFNLTTLDRHIQAIRDIESTFQRIRDGEYGVCIDCGDEVAFNRLEAYPTAKRCVVCQEKREKLYSQGGHPKM